MAVPTPTVEQFLSRWYTGYDQSKGWTIVAPSDQQITMLVKMTTIVKDGVPAINGNAFGCGNHVNDIVSKDPALAKQIGGIGLLRIALACKHEAAGLLPKGYTQKIVDAVIASSAPAFYERGLFWGAVLITVGIGLAYMRKRRGHHLHGALGGLGAADLQDLPPARLHAKLKRAQERASRVNEKMIEAGRGHELMSETRAKSDPLALEWQRAADEVMELRDELNRRRRYHGSDRRTPKPKW